MAFTHLHVHTEFSLLDGSSKIREIAVQAKKLGFDSLAITDHGVMYGVIDFYRACKDAGIRPVIGCEIYVCPGSRFDREKGSDDFRYFHLVLLAENDTGYHNLMKIVSTGFTEGYYYKPRVDYETLEKYHEGIIALSACLAGEVARYMTIQQYEEAKKAALRYENIFGKGNFFLELQDHGIEEQKLVNQQLLRLHRETGIELVCTNDVHYIFEEDAAAHDILLCIQTGKKVSDQDRMRYDGGQYFLKTEAQMAELFPYAPEALENTHRIAQRCNVEIEFGVQKLPRFDVPQGFTAWEYLQHLCQEGFVKRYPDQPQELKERLRYELDTIHSMGYVDYFLIVWDFIHYARSRGIMVGPGRGSAAGSIVSYCLEITDIDPIRYQLLFERFLNPERVSMPDIDVDFCFERRQEVIDYVVEKYGKDCVAQIVTFGTLAARGVIRDVGRVLDLPYSLCDTIAKMIPQELNITIDKALVMNPELRRQYESDEQVKYLIDMSKRLEGLPRHTSMHAAGVVISQKPIVEYVPLSRGSDGAITTQYIMTTLEELGLLKMDFLGLRTLTVIQNAMDLAGRNGKKVSLEDIDYDDKAVLDSIGTGRTEGVFQLESAGMKNFMKELKPQNLEDIIAGISLYRPGPMDFIPKYLKGKNDPEHITYDCDALVPILEPTYGCIVYQEQVMQIVRDLGGYSLGRSDLVRRAMSKKKTAVMEKERHNFIYGNPEEGVCGCIANGIPEKTAETIYNEMMDFAKYAFNKSHAAAYAVVSYQTAWLKYYYPTEFMAALLTSVIDNNGKVCEYILTCRQMGISILPPDINEGDWGFTASEKGIRFGLSAIRSIGRNVVVSMVEERDKNGPYRSLKDFIDRLGSKEINKRTMENFIKSGSMDTLPGTRKQKMLLYPQLMDQKNRDQKNGIAGQMSLFDLFSGEENAPMAEEEFPDVGEYERDVYLALEKESLGLYISGHPMESWQDIWQKQITNTSADFMADEETGYARVRDGATALVGGIITGKTVKITKTNKRMAFITLEDLTGTMEIIVFPQDLEKNEPDLTEENCVFIKGRVSASDNAAAKLICEQVTPLESMPRRVWIRCEDKAFWYANEKKLYDIIDEFPGKSMVSIYLARERAKKNLPIQWRMTICEESIKKLNNIFMPENVKVIDMPIEK
ncbi:MAG: DNA polymerase III subunit alpha [Lachnospiraceae bacterium]|nr:DNA polymerase III subunit alpha [Lachnospiraceae bacterium]